MLYEGGTYSVSMWAIRPADDAICEVTRWRQRIP